MIGVSKLYCGAVEPGDVLRYRGRGAKDLPSHLLQFSGDKKPVVVWNVTRRCNLKCLHCYAQAGALAAPDELSREEGLGLLRDLQTFGVPVVLFSGGEPLMLPHLFDLVEQAVALGMRAVISTTGTPIPLLNLQEVPAIFDLVEEYHIPRICFYHLVYTGRGSKLVDEALSHAQTRALVDLICARTRRLFDAGRPVEVLTVDNHADGPYIYLKLLKEDPPPG